MRRTHSGGGAKNVKCCTFMAASFIENNFVINSFN